MTILRVMALLWATSAFASTSPANDIYSDSLTIQRASAEAPGSLDASAGDSSEEALESVSEVVKASKSKPKKRARK